MKTNRSRSTVPLPELSGREWAPGRRSWLSGFSLVVTVALLLLISMIAVGLLSLSIVAVRSTGAQSDITEARDNARLAMMMALGEVQKTLGPDRRAAAPAAMMLDDPDTPDVEPGEPHLTGVWETWTWDPTARRSRVPSANDIKDEKAERFRGWLASDQGGLESRLEPSFAVKGPGNPVPLVGPGSAVQGENDPPAEVRGGLVPVQAEGGASTHGFAWAVLQEDIKAHVQPGAGEAPATPEARFAALFAPDESGLGGLDIAGELGADRARRHKAISTPNLALAGNKAGVARQSFHHLSPHPLGVLTDTAGGGLRRDLTTEFENFKQSKLRGTRVYNDPTKARGGAKTAPWWDAMADYYDLAERVQDEAGGGAEPLDLTPLQPLSEIDSDNKAPKRILLMPVVAKIDIVFSLVTHDIEDSNEATKSQGSWNYGLAQRVRENDPGHEHCMAWLVFEPIITLWNPYNVPIEFPSLSLGFDYLPLGLHVMEKTWLRGGGNWIHTFRGASWPGDYDYWWRLAAMNQGGAGPTGYNRGFFIRLQGSSSSGQPAPNKNLTLDPGEVRIFTAYVPPGATWAQVKDQFLMERGNTPHYTGAGKILNRSGQGVPYTAGWHSRVGGFRINRFTPGRAVTGDFLVLRRNLDDRFKVQLRLRDNDPANKVPPNWPVDWNDPDPDKDSPGASDFETKILVMTGAATFQDFNNINPQKTLQKLTFQVQDFRDLSESESSSGQGPRKLVLEIPEGVTGLEAYQAPGDTTGEGKTPFGVLTMTAKPTRDLLHPTKGWLFGNPATAHATVASKEAPYSLQPYEMAFREIFSANSFPMVDVDVNTEKRGFFGPGHTAEFGLTAATMFSLPCGPMVSLGQFQTANLLSADALPRFNYPLGNSFAHPLIPAPQIQQDTYFDHSYGLNWRLWDEFYFSSLSERNGVTAAEFAAGATPPNSRLVYHAPGGMPAEEAAERMTTGDLTERSRRVAAHQMVRGAFNPNSTSVAAWRAVLGGLRDHSVPTRDGDERPQEYTPFARFADAMTPGDEQLAIGGGAGGGGAEAERAARWVGIRQLDDTQIEVLARHIVKEIKRRGHEEGGPILTLAEFVNRRPGDESGLHALKGLLQTAIENANREMELYSLKDGEEIPQGDPVPEPAALEGGNTAEGSPAVLLQGDILQAVGAFLSTHSDTLRIRAYGRAGDAGKPTEAWCEAIIQRVPDYLDSSLAPEESPPAGSMNEIFGRRFRVVSFRWLSPDEV